METGDEFKSHGITADTPKNILLGAGTIHMGLKCTSGTWNAAESIIAATSGGNTLTITPEITDLEIDGANVRVQGLAVKTGEVAELEVNIAEVKPDIMKKLLIAQDGTDSSATGYSVLESKTRIEAGDYIENFGYVGKTLEGKPIIIIFPVALCTSGLELGGESKTNSVLTATFACYQKIDGDLEKLPYKIYYPTPTDPTSLQTMSAPKTTANTDK